MAFGKKKAVVVEEIAQEKIHATALEYLRKQRSSRRRAPMRLTFQTPILMQRWTTKAVRQMLGKMIGRVEPRVLKDLTKDFEDSYYRNTKGVPVIPCRIVKACTIEGALCTGGVVTKADLKRSLRVLGHTAPIINAKPEQNTMIVRNASGAPDVRSRASFNEGCYVDVVLEYSLPLTLDQVLSALDSAGHSIGMCEWRPERGGDYGTFSIEPLPSDEKTIQKILASTALPEEQFTLPPEYLHAFESIPDADLPDPIRKVKALAKHQKAQANGVS